MLKRADILATLSNIKIMNYPAKMVLTKAVSIYRTYHGARGTHQPELNPLPEPHCVIVNPQGSGDQMQRLNNKCTCKENARTWKAGEKVRDEFVRLPQSSSPCRRTLLG